MLKKAYLPLETLQKMHTAYDKCGSQLITAYDLCNNLKNHIEKCKEHNKKISNLQNLEKIKGYIKEANKLYDKYKNSK